MTRPRRGGRLPAPLLVVLLVAGCSPAAPPPATVTAAPAVASPTARPVTTAELDAARELVLSNRYDAADGAYAALVTRAPRDPRVHAAVALFDNDRRDFAGAAREAAAAVRLGPTDVTALAVQCRVLDWANQLDGALAAGRQAAALGPSDPAAHLYFAEALADSGDGASAGNELQVAARLVAAAPSPYRTAELLREQGNLARQRGDLGGQLQDLVAARAAEPGWVERTAELADARFGAGDVAGGRAELERATELAPADVGLLSRLGAVAAVQADYPAARRAWARALDLAPNDHVLLDLNAELAMAIDHDPASAEQLLLRAVRLDPADSQAAAYALALGPLLPGGEAAAAAALRDAATGSPADARGRPRVVADPAASLAAERRSALDSVNRVRSDAHLPPVVLDDRLSLSAQRHTWYWLFNNAAPTVAGLGIHRETGGLPGFSGTTPADRGRAAGWPTNQISEVITHRGSASAAVADWADSIYHRFPLVRADLVSIGYGGAAVGPVDMQDVEAGLDPTGPLRDPVVVPGDGQAQVPRAFVDNELPDPLPVNAARTTGYPVTVTFDARSHVVFGAITLEGPAGALPGYPIAPSPATENSAALLPIAPLTAGATYAATATAVVDGHPWSRSWRFTVG